MAEHLFSLQCVDDNGNPIPCAFTDVAIVQESSSIRIIFDRFGDDYDIWMEPSRCGLKMAMHPGDGEDPTFYAERFVDGSVRLRSDLDRLDVTLSRDGDVISKS